MDGLLSMLRDLFSTAQIAGIPILLFTLGLVQWLKDYVADGPNKVRNIRLLSMGVGLVSCGAYELTKFGVPVDVSGWVSLGFSGIAFGFTASRLYDANSDSSRAS